MKVLVVGGGGREHAICWALKKSPKVTELFCAPGNAGISAIATCVPIGATDLDAMVAWAKENAMDLVMVAPDDSLALGMVDAMEAAGIKTFGPHKNAAIIEASKAFSKELMAKYHIPTAKYKTFTDGLWPTLTRRVPPSLSRLTAWPWARASLWRRLLRKPSRPCGT